MNKTIFKMKWFFHHSVSVLIKKGVFFQLESLVTMRKSLKLPLLRCPRMSYPERSRFFYYYLSIVEVSTLACTLVI